MTTLVTGASGFVGRFVCRQLLDAGMAVRAASRNRDSYVVAGCETVETGNLDGSTDWAAALKGVDSVVHLAAMTHRLSTDVGIDEYRRLNVDATRRLAAAAASAGISRFVFMSSVKVNGEASPRDGDGMPMPVRAEDPPQPTTDYGRTKLEAERCLEEVATDGQMAVAVLRPPLVYGPGNKANMLSLFRAVNRGIPLPFASFDNRRSLIYVENLAAAVGAALLSTRQGWQVYTLDDIQISVPDLIRSIAAALGTAPRLVPVPVALMRYLARMTGRSATFDKLAGSLVVDGKRIREELGWEPAVDFDEALTRTAQWFQHGLPGR